MANKVLFITQEITPYVSESEMSTTGRYLPQAIQEKGKEIRTFMPKWGNVNERRNQLHEVIRLSGMNLIIDDTDHPLIIKVASIQAARMQVYFIDNDDYFQNRLMATDENGVEYNDNDERAIFYARGVLETVKKLRWCPDVIHCQGWISALVPLYIKKIYQDEPSFRDTKVVFSLFPDVPTSNLQDDIIERIMLKNIQRSDLEDILPASATYDDLCKLAIAYSDGVIESSKDAKPELLKYASEKNIPILKYKLDEEYAQEMKEWEEKYPKEARKTDAEKEEAEKNKPKNFYELCNAFYDEIYSQQ